MKSRLPQVSCLLAVGWLLTSCGEGGALNPAGEGARRITSLWWLMFWLGMIPLAVVVGMIWATARRKRSESRLTDRRLVVYGGVVMSSLLLVPVVAMTAVTNRNLDFGDDGLTISVTAHQFWWDIEYTTPDGTSFRTANELHMPAGQTVDLQLTATDVIHSVWIPELHGKMDLIPGRVNELQIRADQPGVHQGRCAEFCGLGHAMMQLIVVVESEGDFESWLQHESAPATVDAETSTLQTFANSCAPCHTVRGMFEEEMYEGDFGPDLTHIGSRRMIGANIIPNTVEGLARWIVDPHGVKPGNRMPDVGLDAEELDSVIDLLGQLD